MLTNVAQIQPFVYTNPQGLKLEVLFVLDPAKKGYINATAIAKQFDSKINHWLENANVQSYINSLIKSINSRCRNSGNGTQSISYNDLVIMTHGGSPEQQGTWLHPKLAVIFARWLSPDFAVWCDEIIDDLLRQNPIQSRHQELVPIIYQALAAQEQRSLERINQFEQHLVQHINQRFDQHVNQVADILNHFRSQHLQETKLSLGQIYGSINKIHKLLQQQQHDDLLQPPVQETLKAMLLDYQQVLKQMLQSYQDDLIQGYLVKIEEALAQIMQRVPQVTVENSAVTTPVTSVTTDTVMLATEIATLRAAGNSWHNIANILNERGIVTTSGKGKWHGSSVKRFYDDN